MIRSNVKLDNTEVVILFQFLYGVIRSSPAGKFKLPYNVFQFLYGAIKRIEILMEHYGKYVFQYLYGAVKSSI
ncbi:hypothetical protein [Myroides odoratimimus]|uniref:hypothetical protein n=1 Tax=Myroides odoratimimus TaxID=76832 RepID=UPI000A4F5769